MSNNIYFLKNNPYYSQTYVTNSSIYNKKENYVFKQNALNNQLRINNQGKKISTNTGLTSLTPKISSESKLHKRLDQFLQHKKQETSKNIKKQQSTYENFHKNFNTKQQSEIDRSSSPVNHLKLTIDKDIRLEQSNKFKNKVNRKANEYYDRMKDFQHSGESNDWRNTIWKFDRIDARMGKSWCKSTIMDLRQNQSTGVKEAQIGFRVQDQEGDAADEYGLYIGIGPVNDEWISLFSNRIARFNKKTKGCYITD